MNFQLQKNTYILLTQPSPQYLYQYTTKYRNFKDILNHGQTLWDEWENKMEKTRDLYARFIGADSREEIAFTHS
jgi:selenocysteine lyase/cysteine desulfurase